MIHRTSSAIESRAFRLAVFLFFVTMAIIEKGEAFFEFSVQSSLFRRTMPAIINQDLSIVSHFPSTRTNIQDFHPISSSPSSLHMTASMVDSYSSSSSSSALQNNYNKDDAPTHPVLLSSANVPDFSNLRWSVATLPGTTFTHPLLRNVRAVMDRDGSPSGTRMYLANALVSLALLLGFIMSNQTTGAGTLFTKPGHLCMCIGFVCLMLDNTINGLGKYVGEGPNLRFLTKIRLIAHGTSIPLLFIPMIEALFCHNIISVASKTAMMALCAGISVLEFWDWSRLDLSTLKVVDNRASLEPKQRYLPGILTYTCGKDKILKCLGPVLLFTFLELGVGAWLWMYYRAMAGRYLVSSGLTSLFSGSLGRPDIQMVGETVTMGLLWASLVSLATSAGAPAGGTLLLPGMV